MHEHPARKPRARKTTSAENRIICRTSWKHTFLFSREIKAEIGQNLMSEIYTRTKKGVYRNRFIRNSQKKKEEKNIEKNHSLQW